MHKNLLSAAILAAVLVFDNSCTQHSKNCEQEFKQLDAAIDSFENVINTEKSRIARKTAEFSNASDSIESRRHCLDLMNRYENLSVDSLSKYASIYAQMAKSKDEKAIAAIKLSFIAQMKEDFISCERIFSGIDTIGLSKDVYKKYLRHGESINYSMFVRAFNAESGDYLNHHESFYREILRSIRNEYLSLDSLSSSAILVKVSELRDDKEYTKALDYLLSQEERFKSDRQKTQYYRYQSVLYDFMGENQKRLKALIKSEIHNFRMPTYDHLSLISIARMLSAQDDLERASRYISIADGYALKHKHVARMANAGKASKKIMSELNKARKKSQDRLYLTIAILSIVSIFLMLSLYYTISTRKKLIEANTRLQESDIIKDNYLFKYMAQSVEYLQKADEYHKELRKLAKNDKDMLFAQLRLPSQFENERKEFYKIYDRNFLLLFPGFLDNVNKLMKDDCQYELNTNGTMPVELRVLSVIRLGMTDSQQISAFLNYSLSTVYTYRSRAAEKSLYGREDFEKKLINTPL